MKKVHKLIQDTGSSNTQVMKMTQVLRFFFIFLGTNFFGVVLFFLGVPWVVLGDPSVGWPYVPSPIKNAKRLKKGTKLSNWTLQLSGSIDGWHYCLYLLVSLIGLSCKIVSLVGLVGLVTTIEFSGTNGTIALSFSACTDAFLSCTVAWSDCTVGFSGSLSCLFVLFVGILAFGPYLVVFFLGFLFL